VVSALAIALVLGVAVQIWLRNDYPCPDEMRFFARHPMVRVPEFLIGMLLGRVYLEGLANKEFWRKSTIWFAALAIVAMCVYRAVGIPANALALLPLVGMVFGAAYGKGGIMSNPTLVLLGEASYGLYLLHAPVHMILERLAAKVDFDLTTPVGFLLILVSSVVASVFVHKSFEVPMRNYIRKRFGGGKPVKVGEGR
jgi:peptidoglycan/LPS O-acetylase OafA/YrhL